MTDLAIWRRPSSCFAAGVLCLAAAGCERVAPASTPVQLTVVLTRTYDVKVAVNNPSGRLRVGMIADIVLKAKGDESGLVVPPEAVRVDESGIHHVFVVDRGGKLQRRRVKVARFLGEGIAISEGVREGELVVTSGTPMLSDGATVRVVVEGPDAVNR